MSVVMVTGGVRSGKSAFAEEICRSWGGRVLYVATGGTPGMKRCGREWSFTANVARTIGD